MIKILQVSGLRSYSLFTLILFLLIKLVKALLKELKPHDMLGSFIDNILLCLKASS
jgi:hypothetical protein